MKYSEKLKDPRWQKKRLEIFERDNWTCVGCEDKETTLHVHHIFYLFNTEPWDISNGFLITLCESCHNKLGCNGIPCTECKERDDCDGPGDIPGAIIDCVGTLLNVIWEMSATSDFHYNISNIANHLKQKDLWDAMSSHYEFKMEQQHGQD